MSRWFRFYDDAINEPKLLKLSDALYRAWVGVLCIASKNDGALPPTDDVALLLRMKPEKAEAVLVELIKAGLLDQDETGKRPHNWNARQYKSDVSNERVARYRKRRGNGECNVTGNGTVTASETESDTEAETEQNKDSVAVDFERWWKAYPKRVGRGQAVRAFKRALTQATLEELVAGASRYAADPNRKPEYTKHPTTWLNGECWRDEAEPFSGQADEAYRNIL